MNRSYLFIPGNTPSMLQNLDVFESDAIIIDFEDSVALYNKDAARILVSNFLKKYNFEKTEIFIRINDASSEFFLEDVKNTCELNITGYVLPKALPKDVEQLNKLTNKLIIPIIESPMAVLRSEEIAVLPNIRGLLLGAEDLTKELNISRTLEGSEILYTRSKIILICSAYNIDSIDTPWTDKDNLDGLLIDTLNARNLGFTSKSSIHPNHIDVINTAFTPSEREILEAKRIVKKAETTKKGAFSLDGKMIDLPIIEKAKKTLEKAKKYNLL